MQRISMILAGALALAPGLAAQSLEQRVARAPDGTVRFAAASRPGVCGNGRNNISVRGNREVGGTIIIRNDGDEWERDCEEGPVHVALRVASGKVTRVRTYVGGRWREGDGTDLGTVATRDAAAYLLSLAERMGHGGDDAVFPVTILDSVTPWPGLLRIARNASVPSETRRSAVFWLGQAAADSATAALDSIVGDDDSDSEVRKAAVFALSQRPDDEGIPALLRIARSHRDPEVRRDAIFWLGQSDDPRALELFEELILGE